MCGSVPGPENSGLRGGPSGLADNGSNWYFGGAEDTGWPSEVLDELKSIPAGAFQAVATGRMKASGDSAKVKARYVGV